MKEYLLQLAHYNLWANQKMTTMIPDDPSIWEKEVSSSFTTIKATVLHIWDAQDIWLSRLNDVSLTDWPSNRSKVNSNREITDALVHSSFRFFTFIDEQLPTYPTKIISYKNMKGEEFSSTAQEIIAHCMNHATFHRGQLITMLRTLGLQKFESTDMIAYYRQLKEKKKEILD